MANPPGGPLSGGMEAQQDFARRTVQERQAAEQQQPVQREQPQQQQATPQDREAAEAAARQKVLEENERVAQSRIDAKKAEQELADKQSYNQSMAQQLAPAPDANRQTQQQRQREQQNEL